MTNSRPIVAQDANGNLIQDSALDEKFRAEYDGSNNLIYKGYARPGVLTNATKWQIAKLTYDASGNVTQINWPQNSLGSASNDYIFAWDSRAGYTYS